MMDSVIWGTLIVFPLRMQLTSVAFLSKKVNDRLIRRAIGRYNQTDAHLAIVKRPGNENGTRGSQTLVCKSQERRASFKYRLCRLVGI